MSEAPSYHDLYITVGGGRLDRTKLMNLPFRVHVVCNRVAGWEVWAKAERGVGGHELLGGEYSAPGIKLEINGHVIVDSIPEFQEKTDVD